MTFQLFKGLGLSLVMLLTLFSVGAVTAFAEEAPGSPLVSQPTAAPRW
jgi:hypothetical protein